MRRKGKQAAEHQKSEEENSMESEGYKVWMDRAEDAVFTALIRAAKEHDVEAAQGWVRVLEGLGMV